MGQEDRIEALREYLRAVARDLIMHGVLLDRQGIPPLEMLRREPSKAVGVLIRDLKAAGFSVGQEIVGGAVQGLLGRIFGGG